MVLQGVPHHQGGAESLVLGAVTGREAVLTGAVPADRCPSPFPCRKTARRAVSSTSSSARMGTASLCAGAAMPMRTAWTALMRRTAALGVMAAPRGSLGAGHLPPMPLCLLCPHCGWEHSPVHVLAPLCPAPGHAWTCIRALESPQLCWKLELWPQTGVLAVRQHWLTCLLLPRAVTVRTCPLDEFQCNNTLCKPLAWKCDGEDDCGDNSDENPEECCE